METRRRHRHLSESSSLYYQGVSDQGVSDWSTPVRLSGNYRPFPSVSFPPTAYTSPIDPVHEGSPIIPPEQPPDDESRRDFTVHSHPSYSTRGNQPPGSVFYGPNSGSSSRQSSPSRSTEGRADADDIKQQIHVLKDWLQRDAQDRQAELRAVAARVDQLNDQIRRLAAVPGGVQINQSELRGVAAEVGSLSEEVRRFAAARGAPPPGWLLAIYVRPTLDYPKLLLSTPTIATVLWESIRDDRGSNDAVAWCNTHTTGNQVPPDVSTTVGQRQPQ